MSSSSCHAFLLTIVTLDIHCWCVGVARGLVISIDGTDNEHTDAIRHVSSGTRAGWMDGWENSQKEHVLREMLKENPSVKILSDVWKKPYTAHLYKFAGPSDGGGGVATTQNKLRQNLIFEVGALVTGVIRHIYCCA